MKALTIASIAGLLAVTAGPNAWSQTVPPAGAPKVAAGLSASKTATTGATEVATSSFEAGAKPAATEGNDTTEAKISAGAIATSGNARSLVSTGAGTFRLRRGKNQVSVAAAMNFAKARPADEKRMQTTVENYQGKGRYDRFISKQIALFAAASLRKDRFQGLDARVNLDPGVAYYFIDSKPRQLWTELGYDYQYDLRTLDAVRTANLDVANAADRLGRKEDRHSGRLFVGFISAFNDRVALTAGLEYLQALVDTENYRLVGDAGINANLSGKLSLATTFTMRYDHNPLPGIEKVDTIESVSLVYTLL